MPDRVYDHVLSFALDHPWAITRPMLSVIAGILARRVAGEETDQTVLAAALVNRKNLPQPVQGSVGIIPVYGVLSPRMTMMSEMSGGTTYEKLSGQLREAMSNKAIKTVVLDIDSPGGSVAGVSEFAREVMKARTRKPIIAQVQYTGASAAYWIAAAATKIVAAPSAQVGSIGVLAMHDDMTEALAKLGVKRQIFSAGKHKGEGFMGSALTEEAIAHITASVDEAYARFVGDVVKGRGQGMAGEKVRNDWKALVYGADEALAIGMIDEIATLDDTLARLLNESSADPKSRASLDAQQAAHSSSTPDTAQEPLPATAQDRASDADLEHALFEMNLN